MTKNLPPILMINQGLTGGGANRSFSQLFYGLKPYFHTQALVEKYSGSDADIQTFYPNTSLYKAYFRSLWWTGVATGRQYLIAKLLPGHSFAALHSWPEYRRAGLVHLHNLHGDWFDLSLLPRISREKPLVWTLQDMWALTGHCPHPVSCNRWRNQPCPPGCPHHFCSTPQIIDTQSEFLRRKLAVYSRTNVQLVAPSRWLARKISQGILADKPVTVIPNGADEQLFHPRDRRQTRRRLGLPPDRFIILFAANFATKNPWKGGAYLQALVKSDIFPRALFVTIGDPQPKKSSRLWQTGFISDRNKVADYLAAADILLFPSIADTCPLTVIESLSSGTPVVGFRTGGIPELIRHRHDGYLARYLDLDDLVAGIKFFYDFPGRLQTAGMTGRRKVIASLTIKHMLNRYRALYDRLLCGKI